MKKLLFLIPDLSVGGAEKVLVHLVNNLDQSKFDITVHTLFAGGINEQFLKEGIKLSYSFKKIFRGNSQILKLFSTKRLYKTFIKEQYDIVVSYLEGTVSRVAIGCDNPNTKLVSWIHTKFKTLKDISYPFRSLREAKDCYNRFDFTAYVSSDVGTNFEKMILLDHPTGVLYNTVESNMIIDRSKEKVDIDINKDVVNLVSVGTLKEVKGYDRLLRIIKKLNHNDYKCHLYLLGTGPIEESLKKYISENDLEETISLLGYDTNPYKYVSKCDLFVCSSHTEGFSTAATEALIVGTPVCTVEVSGMKEMLGENNEYGVVTENDEEALYEGIKSLLDNPQLLAHYKEKALERGKLFSTENTVKAVEEMLLSL